MDIYYLIHKAKLVAVKVDSSHDCHALLSIGYKLIPANLFTLFELEFKAKRNKKVLDAKQRKIERDGKIKQNLAAIGIHAIPTKPRKQRVR